MRYVDQHVDQPTSQPLAKVPGVVGNTRNGVP